MPKLVNSVPKYRRHRASGQAIVTLSGKDFYLGPFGSKISHTEYDRLTAEWLAYGRRLPVDENSSITVEELLAAFWQHAESYYVGRDGKPTREIDSYRQAMKPLRALYGSTSVDAFGPLSLKAIRNKYRDNGWARKTINQQVGRIKRIFKWGVENELVPPAILQGLQAVSGLKRGRTDARETEPIKSVPEAVVATIQPFVSRQVWAMVQLQLLTGMRSGEVTIMRPCDLTFIDDVCEYRPQYHKTDYKGKDRVVFLGPQAQSIIRSFLGGKETNEYLFSPQDAINEKNAIRRKNRKSPMTPSQLKRQKKIRPNKTPGGRYTTESYGRAVKYGIEKAECESWSPHQLRHTAATKIRADFGLEAAQIVLGHSRADVTQVYAETNNRKVAEIMSEVG